MKQQTDEELVAGKEMKDGTIAWLTQSHRYYCRRERLVDSVRVPSSDDWTHIAYYTLQGLKIPLASATCPKCGEHIESKCCGDYVRCSCGQIAVDTDRWMPERHRVIGLTDV